MRHNRRPKQGDDTPAGTFRACDRCWHTTDSGAQIELFTDCPVCRDIWLCRSCADVHRAAPAIFGDAR